MQLFITSAFVVIIISALLLFFHFHKQNHEYQKISPDEELKPLSVAQSDNKTEAAKVLHENLNIDISVTTSFSVVEPPTLEFPTLPHSVRYCEYKVKGKNPATNRQKTCHVIARENSTDDVIAAKTNLNPPYFIELADKPPSDGQINYAKSVNIVIPTPCTAFDLSYITHSDTVGTDFASGELITYAGDRDILISPYSSITDAVSAIFYNLLGSDRLAFLIYTIHSFSNNLDVLNLDQHEKCSFFYGLSDNKDLIEFFSTAKIDFEYLRKHNHMNCQGSKKKLEFYNLICDYLKQYPS